MLIDCVEGTEATLRTDIERKNGEACLKEMTDDAKMTPRPRHVDVHDQPSHAN